MMGFPIPASPSALILQIGKTLLIYNMTKNIYQKPSPETQAEALKIARATQRPGQTKEQTKLIAQGVEKGIALYKKQQKEKARELSRKLKKAASQSQLSVEPEDQEMEIVERIVYRQHWLPWLLLAVSWLGWGVYFFVSRGQ
jgi:tRNA C32,U32 (ribose-2'-O)-methylase TrmJ